MYRDGRVPFLQSIPTARFICPMIQRVPAIQWRHAVYPPTRTSVLHYSYVWLRQGLNRSIAVSKNSRGVCTAFAFLVR